MGRRDKLQKFIYKFLLADTRQHEVKAILSKLSCKKSYNRVPVE